MKMPNPVMSTRCAACGQNVPENFLEEHFDRHERKTYRLYECPSCGVGFFEPRTLVSGEWYEKAYPLRVEEHRSSPEDDWRFNTFLEEKIPRESLLDVGCGEGGFLKIAQERGFRGTGVDYDARVIAAAREKGLSDVHCLDWDAFLSQNRSRSYDAITLFDVLEHQPEPARFLKTIHDLLKPGGYLAITLPNARRPLWWGREEHDYPPHHFTRWTPEVLCRFVEKEGFRVVRWDASFLPFYYLRDQSYFYWVGKILPLAKKLLFPQTKNSACTLSEMYGTESGGWLKDKGFRQRIVNGIKRGYGVWVRGRFVGEFMRTHRNLPTDSPTDR
ncbi:MAG: methyltransferase domain-containing protein [Elusimicrobia bacterium]|nr:methyltransferase domain-containing protein [Elusimicrobiota bacterium]